jgi:orotate phosphoribosyltransferase
VNPGEVRELFERHGAISSGHFKLSSGRHSDTYVQCARVLEHPRVAASLANALASRCGERVDVVVSPALGGLLIGYLVALEIGCRFLFTERVDGAMTLRRGQSLAPGERALVVEDVITTGGSAAEVIGLVEGGGASRRGRGGRRLAHRPLRGTASVPPRSPPRGGRNLVGSRGMPAVCPGGAAAYSGQPITVKPDGLRVGKPLTCANVWNRPTRVV